MAQTYAQLQTRIHELQQQAEMLRTQEMQGVIDRIKVAIAHYGLTPEHLFGAAAKRAARNSKAGAAKYGDGQGNVWSGKGKRPNWLREAIASGRSLEDFSMPNAPAKAGKAVKPKAVRQRVTRVLYRDGAGHTWSGMGPRPGWLKDAIASGQSEESLRA
jgi:DNA-binding protein H-NS